MDKQVDGVKVQAFLLFDEKQSFRKLGDIIYQQSRSGEIYVRRDALTVMFRERILYGNLITYGGNGLRQLWDLVFSPGSPLLANKGLVALGLQSAAIVWTQRRPAGLGNVTGEVSPLPYVVVSFTAFVTVVVMCRAIWRW